MAKTKRSKSLRIAIFNDGADTIALLSTWLGSHGHHPLSAQLRDMRQADAEAGRFIERNNADLVLFDVGLPYVSNWDFGEVLQMLPGASGVPFVFTTANKVELEKLVGRTNAYQLTGTPANLEGLLTLIYAAVGRPAPASDRRRA